MRKMEKIVVGLSGGVDSSVAAMLLKEQGYEVVGLFMKNWHDTTGVLKGDCSWDEDVTFAEMVAQKLDIPFHTVDLSEPYRKRVVDYMFNEYKKGRTPNPDVLCNREIKFDLFVNEARKLGADKVATGHYSRIREIVKNGKNIYRLLAGIDSNKDQSYFLCQLSQEQLSLALFPLGEIRKPQVRKLAASHKLATASRKDSQGICFVGKVDLPVFLQQQLTVRKGDIIEVPKDRAPGPFFGPGLPGTEPNDEQLDEMTFPPALHAEDGIRIGTHNGAHFFTVGQRKGINIGGKPEPLFVIHVDVQQNILYTGQGHDHPSLNRKGLFIPANEIHWIREDLVLHPGTNQDMLVRIRYRQPLQKARLFSREKGIYILFDQLQRGITPGQFAAWYDGEELIGSGVIGS